MHSFSIFHNYLAPVLLLGKEMFYLDKDIDTHFFKNLIGKCNNYLVKHTK